MRRWLRSALLGLAFAAGCADQGVLDPAQATLDRAAVDNERGAGRITVMSRNLYIGADVDRVIGALASPDPADDLPALLNALAIIQATDFPSRAAAIAREVDHFRPHVIGLQEVSRLDVDLTPLGIPAVVHLDFLAILQDALQARGQHYRVAASVQNTTAAPFPGISVVDHDVLLVREGVAVGPTVVSRTFSTNIGPVAPGVTILRGWVAIEATVRGRTYTVVNTHLESGRMPPIPLIRGAQALELVASLGSATPAILLGDFNDEGDSPMYQAVAAGGFRDAWAELRPRQAGFTCCHVENLSNREPTLVQRIDYVFARGVGAPNGRIVGSIDLTGARTREKIPGPLYPIWPSDHAGVVATLLTPAAELAGR